MATGTDVRVEETAELISRLLYAWGRPIPRNALEASMVLWRNDALRANVLAGRSTTGLRGQTVSRVGAALDFLREHGQVAILPTENGEQIEGLFLWMRPGSTGAPPDDGDKAEDAVAAARALLSPDEMMT